MNSISGISKTSFPLIIRTVTEEDREDFFAYKDRLEPRDSVLDSRDLLWDFSLQAEYQRQFIAIHMADGVIVGDGVLFLCSDDEVEVGCSVLPEYRNRGYAALLGKTLVESARELYPGRKIVVKIQKDNAASLRVAEKAGAAFLRTEDSLELTAYREMVRQLEEENRNLPQDVREMLKKKEEKLKAGEQAVYVFEVST